MYANWLEEKLDTSTVHEIVRSAVELEVEFCANALPVSLIGMNAQDMATYVRFVADQLLAQMGVPRLFGARNPFEWMDLIALENKTNFFEQRVSEYRKTGVTTEGHQFTTEGDF